MLKTVFDASHFQGEIDFAAVKAAGYDAVILKATQGATFVDDRFAANAALAADAGLLVGAYHFLTGSAAAETQANHFLSIARDRVTLLACDWELHPQGTTATVAQAEMFCLAVMQVKEMRWPLLYSGLSFLQSTRVHPASPLALCPLWLAAYRDEPPPCPAPWERYVLWQYTEKGRIDGVRTPVDLSAFTPSDDPADLARFWLGEK